MQPIRHCCPQRLPSRRETNDSTPPLRQWQHVRTHRRPARKSVKPRRRSDGRERYRFDARFPESACVRKWSEVSAVPLSAKGGFWLQKRGAERHSSAVRRGEDKVCASAFPLSTRLSSTLI